MSELSKKKIVVLLLLNAFTFFLLMATFTLVFSQHSLKFKLISSLILLYLIPPLCTRITLLFMKNMPNDVAIDSKEYLLWWATSSFQVIYLRFSFLEELLRSIPGLYSAWLRLWGSQIGSTTYWSPGTKILDRSFLVIGDRVVMGYSTNLTSHLVFTNKQGEKRLMLAPIVIGENVIVGGLSGVGPGTVMEPNQSTKALSVSPPFSRWRNGELVKEDA